MTPMTEPPAEQTALPAMTARALEARDARIERESAALRANLLRRKAQARARGAAEADLPDGQGLG